MIEDKIIEILVQGGLASVALCSLWVNYKLVTNHTHDTKEIIKENTSAMVDMKVTMAKFLEYLEIKLK